MDVVRRGLLLGIGLGVTAVGAAAAQEAADEEAFALSSSLTTQTEARTIYQVIPAPRGQITDRNGLPLAQNRMGYYAAVRFPFFENPSDADVLSFAQRQIATVNRTLGKEWSIPDERILEHYKNRRWLPLQFSWMLTEDQVAKLEPLTGEGQGVALQQSYQRVYPRGRFAPHILGYCGATLREMPSGPMAGEDPLWMPTEGRSGLELEFDEFLTGKDGVINHLFDEDGRLRQAYITQPPHPGHNLVTTLDAELQSYVEEKLREYTRRGAMVIMEIKTGDILAMGSWPMFDPNVMGPRVTSEIYDALRDDPATPLFGRAFQAGYPPASTYKVPVAAAALELGIVDQYTEYPGPPSMKIGDRTMRNWNKSHEGSLNVRGALKRSCNTWFYQVGRKTKAEQFLSVSRRLGLGVKTGIPVLGETAGNVPLDANYSVTVANLSIGQGELLASPLQVTRMMAGIADGVNVPVPRLILQIQDLNNNIVRSFPPEASNSVGLSKHTLDVVRKGMWDVVHAGNGTGRRAAIKFCEMAGKTGTGEWKKNPKQNVAWFAGFLPFDNPQYAFAALYEGAPGESVSGGGKAAPIVHDVFNYFYENEIDQRIEERRVKVMGEEDEMLSEEEMLAQAGDEEPPPRALPVDEEIASAPRAERVTEVVNAAPEQEAPEEAKRNVFRRIWGRIRGGRKR